MSEEPGQREKLVLRADEDVHALAPLGEAQQLHQVALGLEVGEQLADALQVLQPVDVLEQVGLAAHDQALLVAERTRPGGEPRLDDLLGQLVELGLGRGQSCSILAIASWRVSPRMRALR